MTLKRIGPLDDVYINGRKLAQVYRPPSARDVFQLGRRLTEAEVRQISRLVAERDGTEFELLNVVPMVWQDEDGAVHVG